jgi:hypothetical protein
VNSTNTIKSNPVSNLNISTEDLEIIQEAFDRPTKPPKGYVSVKQLMSMTQSSKSSVLRKIRKFKKIKKVVTINCWTFNSVNQPQRTPFYKFLK